MNKTVNINLASIFFHIDEDAYSKLQHYLNAIKKSLNNSQGQAEILQDIEARIAELFSENLKHDNQVVSTLHVDQVITIMGQPEDYRVDDDVFEDETHYSSNKTGQTKKLFRDTDNSYIGGVSSGLSHYFGIDTIWIRLAWLFLFFVAGTGVFLYIILWILLPEAVSTSDKLMMKGKPVNISNIEKKIKDGFETVTDVAKNMTESISDATKNVDFDKQTNRLKSGSKSFFNSLSGLVGFALKLVAKFIGILLIITGFAMILGLIISLFTIGVVDAVHIPGIDFFDIANTTNAPLWLVSLLLFFALGIPFFFLAYLGLKILVPHLKSIGGIAKYSLIGLWIFTLLTLTILGIKQGISYKERATIVNTETFENITKNDTIALKMVTNEHFTELDFDRDFDFRKVYNEHDEKLIVSQGIRLIVKESSNDSVKLKIEKRAKGTDYLEAKKRAQNITYKYSLNNKTLRLDNYFSITENEKLRDQQITLTLYLPEGITLIADKNTYDYHHNTERYNDILNNGTEGHYLKLKNGAFQCKTCTNDNNDEDDDFDINVNINDENSKIKINSEGLEVKNDNIDLKIDENGVNATSETVKVNIDEDGIKITNDNKKTN